MKTIAKLSGSFGNKMFIQFAAGPVTDFPFCPAMPEISNGGLLVTESTAEGTVGRLTATNKTEKYLLLTDADILVGAKQNRIVNRSILLAPFTTTILDVSCVERLRWHYTTKDFSGFKGVADPSLRRVKAGTMASARHQTQGSVWEHIHDCMEQAGCPNPTESYAEMMSFKTYGTTPMSPDITAEPGCNGLAVAVNNRIVCIDIFGSPAVYSYYFDKLCESALHMQHPDGGFIKPGTERETLENLERALTFFEKASKIVDHQYYGAGQYTTSENKETVGFDLTIKGERVHTGLFMR